MAKAKAKSTSVKKSIKSNKSKKFSLKSLDFKKNWKKLSYLGLAGFLLLSTFGYAAWKEVELQSANAAGLWVKSGNQCVGKYNYNGLYYNAISPSSGRSMSFQATNGAWQSVAYWSPVYSNTGYGIHAYLLKSKGLTGTVTLVATLTLNSGARITDSCVTTIR